MSQLQDNLTEILRQKTELLIPENIKKDVTILGVNGTLETTGNVPVKLFETVEQMNADTTVKENDLALIYKKENISFTTTNETNYLFLPDVLIRPVSEDWKTSSLWFRLSDGKQLTIYCTNNTSGVMGIYTEKYTEMGSTEHNYLYSVKKTDENYVYTRIVNKYYRIPSGPATIGSTLSTDDWHGIQGCNIFYDGTYTYNDGWAFLPKGLTATASKISSGHTAEVDEGIVEGQLSCEVVINNGDKSADVRKKIKMAYTGCHCVRIYIKRTDDWTDWTPIEMNDIGGTNEMGYVSLYDPIEVFIENYTNISLPSNGLFCGTDQMGYTVTSMTIRNNGRTTNAGNVFGNFSGDRDIRYNLSDNYATVDQTLPVGMDCKITLSNANTTLSDASNYAFTHQYNKLSLIYMIYKAPTVTDSKTLSIPSDMYSACTEAEWKVLTDKGWTITQI